MLNKLEVELLITQCNSYIAQHRSVVQCYTTALDQHYGVLDSDTRNRMVSTINASNHMLTALEDLRIRATLTLGNL